MIEDFKIIITIDFNYIHVLVNQVTYNYVKNKQQERRINSRLSKSTNCLQAKIWQ